MSDESKENPPAKLKLSRDLKDPGEAEATKVPPSMKLRRKEPEENPPPQPQTPPVTSSETPPSPPAGDTQPEKPGFDPKNPFGDVIKQSEIKAPSTPPPELPSKPAPKVDDGSGAKVEEAIDSMQAEEAVADKKNSFLSSILVLLALLLVLAGAGYGLWLVLQSPAVNESADTDSAKSVSTTEDAAPKGLIQKAKEAIAKVPVAGVEAITGNSASKAAPTETTAETATESNETIAAASEPEPVAPIGTIEGSKQSASQYLSGIHIGGVRKGERPMILIGGESFQVGDVV